MTRLEHLAQLVAHSYEHPLQQLAVRRVHGDGWLLREAADALYRYIGWSLPHSVDEAYGTPGGNDRVNEALKQLLGWEYLVLYECCRSKGSTAVQVSLQSATLVELRPLPHESILAFVAWLQMAPRNGQPFRGVSIAEARLFARSLAEHAGLAKGERLPASEEILLILDKEEET